jgi:hypothetical protein
MKAIPATFSLTSWLWPHSLFASLSLPWQLPLLVSLPWQLSLLVAPPRLPRVLLEASPLDTSLLTVRMPAV